MTERIDIVVQERGARTVKRSLSDVGNSADKAERQVNNLRNAIYAVGGVAAITGLVRLADQFTTIQNRLKTVTTSTAQLGVVTDRLLTISNQTRSSFESTAELYARVGLAAKDLGVSQQQVLDFTKSLNQAVILSGASAQEASAGIIQLSQGLASGTLRGDELRSVLEQLPAVADVIAKSLGVTRGELRLLGQEGKITADIVLKAFEEARTELDERFAKTVPTVAQSFQIFQNQLIVTIGKFNEASGASQALSKLIVFLADNMQTLLRIVSAVAIAVGINFAVAAIRAAISGLAALAVAIATNPIGALAQIIIGVSAALVAFGDQLQLTQGSTATVLDFIIVAFQQLADFLLGAVEVIGKYFGFFQKTIDEIDFLDLIKRAADFADKMVGVFYAVTATVQAIWENFFPLLGDLLITGFNTTLRGLYDLPKAFSAIFKQAFEFVRKAAVAFVNRLISIFNKVPGVSIDVIEAVKGVAVDLAKDGQLTNPFQDTAANIGEVAGQAYSEGYNKGIFKGFVDNVASGAEARAQERAAKEAERLAGLAAAQASLNEKGVNKTKDPEAVKQLETLAKIQKALTNENEILVLNSREREIRRQLLEIEDQVGRKLTDTESAATRALIEQNTALKLQADILDEIKGPQESLADRQTALNALWDAGRITAAEYNRSIEQLLVDQAALNASQPGGTFVDGLIVSLDRARGSLGSFASQMGEVFGNTFDQIGKGFADTIGQGIFDVDNLGESFKSLGRDIISSLVSSLIQVGVQQAANFALQSTLGAAATAQGTAQAATLAAAYAPAAAAASLATAGANAVPAGIGIGSIFALLAGLVGGAALAGFADGTDFVTGRGTGRSDSVLAKLSRGEGVVTAEANAANPGVVGAMNRGERVGGSTVNNYNFPPGTDVDSFRRSQRQIDREERQRRDRP